MTSRTTRNKIRFQGKSALEDLRRAQEHLTGLAALAEERSPYIEENLPTIMVALESVRVALSSFYEGL